MWQLISVRQPKQHRFNYINYSNTTKNNILFIDVSASRRKPESGLTSAAGHQYVKVCPIRGSMVAPFVSIHVVGLRDPYRLPYESNSFVWFSINHLGVRPVYHMILIANTTYDCRFVADTGFSALVKIPVILSTYDVLLLLLPVAFLFLQRRHVHSFYTISYKPPLAFPRHWFCLWGAPADFST